MQFIIQKRKNENLFKYPTDDIKLVRDFAQKLKNELDEFLVAVIMFGSSARRSATAQSDIDVLIITDDISFNLTRALVESYRIIVEKLISNISNRLHITSMTFTSFWEYMRVGDPVAINILRDGISIMDTGFFNPMQLLLKQGRIRPTDESIWRYFGRAPKTLTNSKWHLLQATLDLYWAVIDAAHAALMRNGETPPSPEHAADLMYEKLTKKGLLEREYVDTMRRFYKLSKMITHREIKEIKGAEYDKYLHEATYFVERMKILIQEKK